MMHYAMKTSRGNIVFITFLEDTNINTEVAKWEESSGGETVEAILKLEGLPNSREEREELRDSLKQEDTDGQVNSN